MLLLFSLSLKNNQEKTKQRHGNAKVEAMKKCILICGFTKSEYGGNCLINISRTVYFWGEVCTLT